MMANDVDWDRLFEVALAAQARAYAPYSRFPVGAALLAADGRIFAGCNVENSSYGLAMCAERNAVGRALADGVDRFVAVAVVASSRAPCPPCGSCRQVLAEFCDPQTPVHSRAPDGSLARFTVADLLPHAFTRDFL
jgi:cytidine deaminase